MSDQVKSTQGLASLPRRIRMRLPERRGGIKSRGDAESAPNPAFGANGDRPRGPRSVGAALRAAGRLALWALIALVLVRGLGDVIAGPGKAAVPSAAEQESGFVSDQARALAVGFARAYMSRPTAGSLAPYLAPGLSGQLPRSPAPHGERVAQATVAEIHLLAADRALATVACELAGNGTRVLYLAVPVARDPSGSLSVSGLPFFVPAPRTGRAKGEGAAPVAGPGGAEIRRLAQRFLAAYLSPGRAGELSYLVAPGEHMIPLGPGLRLIKVIGIGQAGSTSSPEGRTVLVRARVKEATSSATYPVAYRLELVHRDRWYVAAVEGAPR
jgi:Conjugative transposon protein TcpC